MTDEPVEVPESLEVKSQMISEYAASLGVELHPDWIAALTIEKLQRKLAGVQEHNLADAKIADLADVIDDAVQRVVAKLTTPPPSAVQPVIHVNVDTGAISQALLLGMKSLMETQTHILSGVLHEVAGSVESVKDGSVKLPVKYDEFTPQEFTPQEQKKSKRKGVKQSVKHGVNQKPTKGQILQFYRQIGEESLRKAGKNFGVSHQTIKNILEGG